MSDWKPPAKPADYAEKSIVGALVNGKYPAGTRLPAERELAAQLGITRPTLREVLQRLGRDGWITIRQGKATVVNDFWREGGLNMLSTLAHYGEAMPENFVTQLLEVRLTLAPAYTYAAFSNDPEPVIALLGQQMQLEETAAAYTTYDWALHRTLSIASGNPIYTLILNGFTTLYAQMARRYFSAPENRLASHRFYVTLLEAFRRRDAEAAAEICRSAMAESIVLWRKTSP